MPAQVYWFIGMVLVFVAIAVIFKTKTENESRKKKLIEEAKQRAKRPPRKT